MTYKASLPILLPALETKLKAISGLTSIVGTKIYFDVAPDNTTYPYAIYSVSSGLTDMMADGLQDFSINIRINSTNLNDCTNGIAAISNEFGETLTLSGVNNYRVELDEEFFFSETLDDDRIVYTAGGIYIFNLNRNCS